MPKANASFIYGENVVHVHVSADPVSNPIEDVRNFAFQHSVVLSFPIQTFQHLIFVRKPTNPAGPILEHKHITLVGRRLRVAKEVGRLAAVWATVSMPGGRKRSGVTPATIAFIRFEIGKGHYPAVGEL